MMQFAAGTDHLTIGDIALIATYSTIHASGVKKDFFYFKSGLEILFGINFNTTASHQKNSVL
jgi:hypothetical protein